MADRRPISNTLRFATLHRFNFKCAYCGATASETELVIDHLKPVASGGDNNPRNLVAACVLCNAGKSDLVLKHMPPLPALTRHQPIRDIDPFIADHREWEREEAIAAQVLRALGEEPIT